MSVETLKSFFDWGAVILIFLTFAFGAGALITGDTINKRQDERLRQFDKSLTDAKVDLGKQQERAAKAESDLVALQKDTADARAKQQTIETNLEKQRERAATADARVAGLEHDAAEAKTEMAKQQERAANAERQLLELQERVKLRRLASDQRKKLVDFLQTPDALAVPKGPIRIQRLIFDETAQPFASDIKNAFAEGGWPSDDVGRDMIPNGGTIPVGIVLIFHDRQNIPQHAGLIQHALIAAGLEPTLGENLGIPEGMVEIMVGIKP